MYWHLNCPVLIRFPDIYRQHIISFQNKPFCLIYNEMKKLYSFQHLHASDLEIQLMFLEFFEGLLKNIYNLNDLLYFFCLTLVFILKLLKMFISLTVKFVKILYLYSFFCIYLPQVRNLSNISKALQYFSLSRRKFRFVILSQNWNIFKVRNIY